MIRVRDIQRVVAKHRDLPVEVMFEALGCGAGSRERAHPRQEAMYLATILTAQGLSAIGRHFGGRDHTTVIHARKSVTKRLRTDDELRNHLRRVTRELV
jgi:chromosomal replication initiator protein